MNFALPMGILVVFLGYKIFNNLKNKTKDPILYVLGSSKQNEFVLRIFTFITILFAFFWISGKGLAQINAFWFFFGIFWVYLLTQKKLILKNGIGVSDIFKSAIYLVQFKEIESFEKLNSKVLVINYKKNNKEFQLKLLSTENSISDCEKLLAKNIKFRKK